MSGLPSGPELPTAPGDTPTVLDPPAAEIQKQLKRIVSSEQFRDSLRLTRFLSYVVVTALTGKTECIKAYTVATQALGRGSDFDPQNDAIVRVEAGRLRQALKRYYAEAGCDDPLVIDLPRGSYVPSFRRRDATGFTPQIKPESKPPAELNATASDPMADPAGTQQPARGLADFLSLPRQLGRNARQARVPIFKLAFAAIAVLAILGVLFDVDRPLVGEPNHGLWHKLWPASNAAAQRSDGAPTIYVEPVTAVGEPIPGLSQPKMIRERLNGALARYDDVTVVVEAPQPGSNAVANTSQSGLSPSSLYRLSSSVRYSSDRALLTVRLIDTANASIAWSKEYEHPSKPDPIRKNGLIAPDVARSLLDLFGVIQARERVKLAGADPMKDTYRCILDANAYLRSFDPSQYRPVHDCLVSAGERTPPAVTVFADLAFVYLRNYRFGIGGPPGEPTVLDNAYAMAARAVDIKPESAFAQYALGSVLLAKGDIERAKIASDKSYRLNPDDGAVAFGHATILVLTGEIDAGLALLDKNTVKSPNSWIGYHLVKALGCYLKGDLKTAGVESRQIANPFFPPGLMLDALIADKAGDRARAQQDIAMLYQFYPAWREHFRASVGRYLPESAMADRVAADFKAAVADTAH